MSFVWSTARKDLLRLRRDPAALVMWVGLPLAIGALLTMASGGKSGPSPQAHVMVVDKDDSFLSRMLVGALSQDAEGGGLIRAEKVTEEDGRARIDKGEADALLVIPDGFDQAVLEEKPATLELVKNPARIILPGIVEESLSILTDGVFYLHRLLGDDLRNLAQRPDTASVLPDQVVADFSVKVNRTMDRLSSTLFPPVIDLEVIGGEEAKAADTTGADTTAAETAAPEKKEPSVAIYFLPGLLFMSLMFMSQGLAQDLWQERNRNTLRRAAAAPHDVAAFLAGKVLYGALLMAAIGTLTLTAAWIYFGLRWALLPLAVVWTVTAGVWLNLLLTIVMLHASNERTAGVLAMVIIFPLMMVGGSFFPFEAMPAGMAAIGKLTPNGWALSQLNDVLRDRVHPGAMAAAFAGALATGAILMSWSAARLRSRFVKG